MLTVVAHRTDDEKSVDILSVCRELMTRAVEAAYPGHSDDVLVSQPSVRRAVQCSRRSKRKAGDGERKGEKERESEREKGHGDG